MYKNICLSGASTLFRGFASRIGCELRKSYLEKNLKFAKDKTIKIPINIINDSFPRRRYSAFIGSILICGMYKDSFVDTYWISRQDWEECGPNIVLKKCRDIKR